MEFLGNLGIDPKMLIAQIVNFGALLWLLARFVYKPIVKRIEKDEQELEKAETEAEKLNREKRLFEREKGEEMRKIREQSKAIIEEAENIAEEIKKQSREKAEKQSRILYNRAKENIRSQEASLRKEIFSQTSSRLEKDLSKAIEQNIRPLLAKEFQEKTFFASLKRQLGGLPLKNIPRETGLGKALKGLESKAANKTAKQRDYGKEIGKILNQKIGPVVLEYAFPLPERQKKEIEALIAEKIGFVPEITEKQDPGLISGFRLEIAGNLIESNLSRILSDSLEYALKEKK